MLGSEVPELQAFLTMSVCSDGSHVVSWSIGNDWNTPMTIVSANATINGAEIRAAQLAPAAYLPTSGSFDAYQCGRSQRAVS